MFTLNYILIIMIIECIIKLVSTAQNLVSK